MEGGLGNLETPAQQHPQQQISKLIERTSKLPLAVYGAVIPGNAEQRPLNANVPVKPTLSLPQAQTQLH